MDLTLGGLIDYIEKNFLIGKDTLINLKQSSQENNMPSIFSFIMDKNQNWGLFLLSIFHLNNKSNTYHNKT